MARRERSHDMREGHDGRGGLGSRRRRARRAVRPAHDAPTTENISLFEEGDNEFAQAMSRGHRLDPRARKVFIMVVILIVLYVVAIVIPKDMLNEIAANNRGRMTSGYSFSWFVDSLMTNVNGIVAAFTGHDGEVGYSRIMFRYIVIAISGAGLAACGAVYQGSFRNALVSPSSMGVMSGAGAGMLLWVLFFVNDDCSNVPWITNVNANLMSSINAGEAPWDYLWASYSLSVYSFIGCALIAGLVLLTMAFSKKGSTSGLMIIITGQVFGGIIGSATSMARYYMTEVEGFETKLEVMNTVSIGSFYRDYSWIDIVAVGIPIVLCVAVVMLMRQRMMVLSLGNEAARSMGVDSKRTQIVVVGVSTLLTAIIISFCGRVGFVGFLIPHLARRIVGPNFKYLLPAAMALGALFVMTAYILVSCTLGPAYETMVGMFISIGGAAIFLVQALRGAGGGGGLGHGSRG